MNVVFYDELPTTEQNPYASWIIRKAGVSGLVQIKAIGTVIAVALMLWLIKTKYRFVIIPVFLFQLGLFLYISFYTPDITNMVWDDWSKSIKLFLSFIKENTGHEEELVKTWFWSGVTNSNIVFAKL